MAISTAAELDPLVALDFASTPSRPAMPFSNLIKLLAYQATNVVGIYVPAV